MGLSHSGKESGDIAILVKSSKPGTIRLGQEPPTGGWKRGVGIVDLILRVCAIAATFAADMVMGTTSDKYVKVFSQFFRFHASYDDLPTFTFFLAGNAIACAYLVASLPFSVVCIVRPHIVGARILLLIFDTLALALTMAAASSAATIVYLAHKGNPSTNWPVLCQQFNEFCPRVSDAVMGSFIGVFILVVLVVVSAVALSRN
ncbi:hypothetical protein R6Q59_024420 [Mikania micrantha]|uniref:CASP-like protein n=1 Tax=Mikania micrantha TaxID=192012 RepID=A0A5N6P3F4_9ASTR|nr:hypothetical protein E3N88_14698 [Mikania micrantha]